MEVNTQLHVPAALSSWKEPKEYKSDEPKTGLKIVEEREISDFLGCRNLISGILVTVLTDPSLLQGKIVALYILI
jgi:hypothetical protein